MKLLDRLEEGLIALLMGSATLIIFVAVMHRYVVSQPIPYVQDALLKLDFSWAQELCIIMFVWMAKFGAAYGVRTGIHVGVDVAINQLPERIRRKFVLFGLMAGAFFTGAICVFGAKFIWENGLHYALLHGLGLETGDLYEGPVTPDLEWPTWFVYSAIPMGSALMCFRFLQVAWSFHRSGELPRHDHSRVEGIADDENWLLGEAIEAAEEVEHGHPKADREKRQ